MRNRHADLIHAWAEGAEIQYQDFDGTWRDEHPTWQDSTEYRIKPEELEPVVRWLWAYCYKGDWLPTTRFYSEQEAKTQDLRIKLEWTATEFPE